MEQREVSDEGKLQILPQRQPVYDVSVLEPVPLDSWGFLGRRRLVMPAGLDRTPGWAMRPSRCGDRVVLRSRFIDFFYYGGRCRRNAVVARHVSSTATIQGHQIALSDLARQDTVAPRQLA